MRQRLLALTATLAVGALTLTACGSRDEGNKGGSDGDTKVVIGLDAPLTGDLSALGLGMKNSVDLAVKTANKEKYVKGVTFELKALDDQAQPTSGQQNATTFVGQEDVIGVVGPLNSSVGEAMQKVFNDANTALVSPANTNPSLTQGLNWQKEKKRPFASYFRTATTDAIQGPFAAQYVYNEAKLTKAFIIDDKKTYGAGLAATFKGEYEKLGGKVVGTEHINPEAKDFAAVATKVKSSGAQVVFYGGEYPAGGPLSKQIKAAGADVAFVGGDALKSPEYIKLAGKSSEGDFATLVGSELEKLDSAKEFIANYQAEGYKDAYEAYGGYSYDAAWSIIEAVKAVTEKNDGKLPEDARKQVVEALQGVSFEGVSGTVSFDEFGDTTNKQLTVYEVKNGEHVAVKSGTFTD
ncbi:MULTISPECIES: branched-chain amino acid ABC transporter substrate-binding protein [Streptomyces]|uniref:Branched-chain amino acid ABC transporter substrate-binding protein n=1 Tax=Streptomyces chilikensis TaxID=1194079 RepID=A0ABV3EUC4_9ACTN|nr:MULTISPECIES: branched-chain amino acid ABC transporter substrate-binding protein [Streptomyces]MDH6227481.1 branched-chain amino acid transport system substrate-binding protein [Streptomyces sp. MJP52]